MRFIARFRPSPALVVATLALLVALGGTSVAAVALVPKNSVGSAQVIDGSLTGDDFQGGQALAGSGAFSRSVDGPIVPKSADDFTTIASLPITKPGAYLIWSTARVDSSNLGGVCRLLAGPARSETRVAGGTTSSARLWNVVVQAFVSPGTVDLQCGGDSRGLSRVSNIRVTAFRLGEPGGS